MARRVELDLLDQDRLAEIPLDGGAAPAGADGEPGQAREVRASLPFRFRNILQGVLNLKGILSRFKGPETPSTWKSLLSRMSQLHWKSMLSWKVLVPAGVAVALIAAGSVSYLLWRQKEAAQVAAEKAKQMAATVPVVREAVFPDFSVDIKDARGQYRFLQCDITLEFQAGVELTEDRKAEIRKVIYLAAQKKGQELIRSSDSGSRLKKQMHDELRNLLGEDALKDIYFTRYVLL
jgi:flagellar basal body-associated protein FliL